MQNVPSIESAGDSDSDDEEEDLFFSGLNNNNEEVRLCNTLESPKHSTEANVQSYNSTAVTDTPGTNLSRRSSMYAPVFRPNISKATIQLAT